MSEFGQKNDLVISHKQGVPVYRTNPSVPDPDSIKKRRPVRVGNAQKGFVVNADGEVLGDGAVAFYEFEEIDETRFVKVFLEGLKQTVGLSKAALSVFELVYRQIQSQPNTDKVEMNYYIASERIAGLNERTYQRGIRELLEKEFIFRSPSDDVFFVNIRYMFNGDRLAFVKAYKRKPAAPSLQSDLFDQIEGEAGGMIRTQRGKLEDVVYTLTPSREFILDVKAANRRRIEGADAPAVDNGPADGEK